MQRPLRILMVLHMPWDANLGGPRIQMELAEEFRREGHFVEKFDYNDAFPKPAASKLANIRRDFAAKAKAYVIKNAHRFDIIDAHQSNLPFSKKELGFNGLLVARSGGLYALHDQYLKWARKRWPEQTKGKALGNIVRWWYNRRHLRYCAQSLTTADLILVINRQELSYVQEVLKAGDKARLVPNALTHRQHTALFQAVQPTKTRLANSKVVFIGAWTVNKGSLDWGGIIKAVKVAVPQAQFLFLGAGCTPQKVMADLALAPCDWIEIVPFYDNAELPTLLSDCTVGAFPSYVEGFGLAVLEKLSCGLPTVSYAIAGPAEMLDYLGANFMAPRGDVSEFSKRVISLLKLDEAAYARLSERCIEIAHKFCWSELAPKTMSDYREFLPQQGQGL